MTKETLEEAAQRLSTNAYIKYSVKDNKLSLNEQIHRNGGFIVGFKEGMVEGIKWQSKRMYSEEEVKQIIELTLIEYSDFVLSDVPHWFIQFKKKK